MKLITSIATISSLTTVSRILGFCRDVLIASVLGTSVLADVFFVAFKIPNLFRRLFAEGAFSAVFVPYFAGILGTNGIPAAKKFGEEVLSILLWSLLVFVVACEMAMPVMIYLFAPGFASSPEQFDLAVDLSRITFPYLLFISLVSLMSGLLNSVGKFAAAAATPILLNISLIGAILWLSEFTSTPAHALAWGVAFAGMLQFLWLCWNLSGRWIALRLIIPRLSSNVRDMLFKVVPAVIGAGVYQISLLIDTIIASFLPSGSISYLFFADRINQLPMGVIGVAVGTALLPLLARQINARDFDGANQSQNRALELTLFLSVPASISLVIIAEPSVRVLFERGAFGSLETIQTAKALAVYATGVPAYVLVKVLVANYFARKDTYTPVKIAFVAVLVNLVLNLILMGPFLHVGIAAATSISGWVNALLLTFVMLKRKHLTIGPSLRSLVPKVLFASVGTGIFLFVSRKIFEDSLQNTGWENTLVLLMIIVLGASIYGVLSLLLGLFQPKYLGKMLKNEELKK